MVKTSELREKFLPGARFVVVWHKSLIIPRCGSRVVAYWAQSCPTRLSHCSNKTWDVGKHKFVNVRVQLGITNANLNQACSTCITNGRSCSYDANVKKRGLPEGYVRGLEKLWGIAIKEVDTIEDSILTALAGNEDSNKSVLNVWNDESTQLSISLLPTGRCATALFPYLH